MNRHQEFWFPALCAAALVLVTSIPYILGEVLPFPGSHFNHALTFDADFNAYFAFTRQSASGQWLFHNPFTSEPHAPVFFNLEWLALGKLARFLSVSLEAALHIQRVLAIFLLSFAFYWLSSFLLTTVVIRRLVFVFAMLGGGFGWLPHTPGLQK